jgi:hypothetical protein
METADLAELERFAQHEHRALQLFAEALTFEAEAAHLGKLGLEPTRSVLFRSAACMALDCGLYGQASELTREARRGSPSPGIAVELGEIEVEIQRRSARQRITA